MWILGSLDRPHRLALAIRSIIEAGVSTPGLIVVGPEDPLPKIVPPGWTAIRRPRPMSVVEMTNWVLQLHPDLEWYGGICDDNIVRTQGWDAALVAAAGRTGIASSNDLQQAPRRMQGAIVWGGDLVRTCGFLQPPMLHHCYVDDFWERIGRRFGIWKVLEEIVVEHHHPLHGTAADDPTYRLNYSKMGEDQLAYMRYVGGPDYAALEARISALLAPQVQQERLARARSRRVMICTPMARHPVRQYTMALVKSAVDLAKLGIELEIQTIVGSSNLPRARNELVAQFLASNATDLLFIDDDMGWRTNDIVRLLASEQRVIGAVGARKRLLPDTSPEKWCLMTLPPEEFEQDAFGAIKIAAIGTGFLKIERSVFEEMAAAHPEWKRPGQRNMPDEVRAHYHRFFCFDSENPDEIGEDYGFCREWRRLGGSVWVDPALSILHVGEHEFGGDFAAQLGAGEAS